MMNWYTKYLSVFEKPFSSVPLAVIEEVRGKLEHLNSKEPLASVVVIAHNEEKRLMSCLWSLSEMVCKYPIEIIGINNHSSDITEEVFKQLGIVYYNEDRKGPGFARQRGLEQARGRYYLCIDADTIYPPFYVETHISILENEKNSCSFSLWSFIPVKSYSKSGLFFYELLRDIYLNIQYFKRPELCVRGMAFAFNTEYGKRVGFRTDIKRGEDGSMALRLKEFGKIVFIRSKKTRVITSSGTINSDGSLLNSLRIRIKKGVKAIPGFFFRKKQYKDEDSNLIKE